MNSMRLFSIQVGQGQWLESGGKRIYTAIQKCGVDGAVATNGDCLEGDDQIDKPGHGGYYQAVYGFPYEEYSYWSKELGLALSPGAFGENLTIEGLVESEVFVGDRFKVGSVELVARCPRIPCATLAARMGAPEMIEKFIERGRPGVYFSIEVQGSMRAGDSLDCLARSGSSISLLDVYRLSTDKNHDLTLLREAATLESLPPKYRERFSRLATA